MRSKKSRPCRADDREEKCAYVVASGGHGERRALGVELLLLSVLCDVCVCVFQSAGVFTLDYIIHRYDVPLFM